MPDNVERELPVAEPGQPVAEPLDQASNEAPDLVDEYLGELWQYGIEEAYKRNAQVTKLVENSLSARSNLHENRLHLRKVFFWIVCLVFITVIIVGLATILILALKETVTLNDLGVVGASLGSIIVAILKLPEIIATHLFPPDGDKMDDELLAKIIEFDHTDMDSM
ncbi:MAG: hypothetical protein FWH50_02150 [Coriobacteriia bacterium]|nr:hypothetical protein [Coriobacteriia bacterium]